MSIQEKLLPTTADELGRKLVGMVLPSARELRRAAGLSPDQAKEGMKELVGEGLVDRG